MDGDGVTDEPVKLAATVTIESGGCRRSHRLRRAAQVADQRHVVADVLGRRLRAQVPDRSRYPGERRLLPAGRHQEPPRLRRPRPAPGRRRRAAGRSPCSSATCSSALWRRRLPDRVVAGTKGCVCNIAFGGVNPASGEYFTYYETIAGGYGATLTTDGMDAVQSHFQNTENAPIEETETSYPVRIVRYELIENSEGGGRHRGGLGRAPRLTLPRPHAELLDPLGQGPLRAVGPLRRRGGAAGEVHPEPGDAAGPRAAVEDHLPAAAGRRRERADSRRRRHRVGRSSAPPRAWRWTSALGKISAERARTVYGVIVDPQDAGARRRPATAAERGRRA